MWRIISINRGLVEGFGRRKAVVLMRGLRRVLGRCLLLILFGRIVSRHLLRLSNGKVNCVSKMFHGISQLTRAVCLLLATIVVHVLLCFRVISLFLLRLAWSQMIRAYRSFLLAVAWSLSYLFLCTFFQIQYRQ